MNQLPTIIYLLIASFLFGSCNSAEKKKTPAAESTVELESTVSKGSDIQLNNGEKWEVNPEMKPFILEAEQKLKNYRANKEADYQALAKDLQEKNTELIKSCTMKGKSHDELHKWLHPHMALIDRLNNVEENQEVQKIIDSLTHSFDTYHQHFQ